MSGVKHHLDSKADAGASKTYPQQALCLQPFSPEKNILRELKRRIMAAIVNSQTLEEVARLEQALKSGQLPALNISDGDNAPKSESAQPDNMITDEKEADIESKIKTVNLNKKESSLQKWKRNRA